MLKLTKSLFKDNLFIIAIGITLGIAYLSLMQVPKTQLSFTSIDKVYHLFAYFTLTICWLFSFYKKPSIKFKIVIACIVYGIIIEVLQHTLTKYRTGDFYDVLANTVGIFLGMIVFNLFLKKIKVNSY
ncbi:VanZ family protein [Polaribacter sp. Z022]|uniref:VanZ family protein n=1 Tax=Polaribacter sp. Z022 TaxID=2927125 RepID=UPI0020201C29|nr:VanZ family protein [Polaribacter sp. Z022]MCL7752300.1 VanZ family protein [Polaribacter sp. Z022]